MIGYKERSISGKKQLVRQPSQVIASTIFLNRDLLLQVLHLLTLDDIAHLSNTSSEICTLLQSDFVWEQLWKFHYAAYWLHPTISQIRSHRRIIWDPYINWGPPSQGWKLFYLEFMFGK